MSGNDHQQHGQRHDHDVAVLQQQVREVERLHQRSVCHVLEEHHDHGKREQHSVLANILLDEVGHCGRFDRRCNCFSLAVHFNLSLR